MKKYFYIGVSALILFELANVYFIMATPPGRDIESTGLAYFLFTWKWSIRMILFITMLIGLKAAWKSSRVTTLVAIALLGIVSYMTNFRMEEQKELHQPKQLLLLNGNFDDTFMMITDDEPGDQILP